MLVIRMLFGRHNAVVAKRGNQESIKPLSCWRCDLGQTLIRWINEVGERVLWA